MWSNRSLRFSHRRKLNFNQSNQLSWAIFSETAHNHLIRKHLLVPRIFCAFQSFEKTNQTQVLLRNFSCDNFILFQMFLPHISSCFSVESSLNNNIKLSGEVASASFSIWCPLKPSLVSIDCITSSLMKFLRSRMENFYEVRDNSWVWRVAALKKVWNPTSWQDVC